jgi:heme oxygenase
MAWLANPAVYRAQRIESDLHALCGPEFSDELPLLASGERYALRIRRAASGAEGASGLVGHAYVRYLGDLNGGRTVVRRLRETLDLESESLSFYAYPEIPDLEEFKRTYRAGFEAAGSWIETDSTVAEAMAAFELNIEVSEEVRAHMDAAIRRS